MKIKSRIRTWILGIDTNALGIAGEELEFLMKHVPSNSVVMEIGCAQGQTTRRFADKGNKVYAIDPFLSDKSGKTLLGDKPSEVRDTFLENTIGKNVEHYQMTSKDALAMYQGEKLDFIFIDAEHSYKALEIDIKWLEYLNEGGLVAFHDGTLPEVNDFLVKNVFPKYEFIGSRASTFIFKKGEENET